ncbi:hypothetical protein GIW81_01760 [Hyphomicrobium sp. xq]|uniref:Uncharacterized protein n=1 Tax=Hyphomicrobium album TaxID=2665159 RepID=A0A6I3KCB0_9HYPH|nr:hypothetical protein [Hyphomicrobium album]MTD93055.1 hypothetical protein [Hyphomicrobium album]
MHALALTLAAVSVAINGLAFAISGLLNEPKVGACFGGAAALSLVALLVGYDDVTALAWTLMAATLTAIAALGVFAISLREGRGERTPDAERARQSSDDRSAAPEGAPKLNEGWAYLAFIVPAVVPAAASLAALLN